MDNLKEIVNIQVLFVLTLGYVDMATYPLTKYYYITERVYFIYTLFILLISTLSSLLFLYTVSWRYKKDYLHASIDILFYIRKIEERLESFIPRSHLRYKKGSGLKLPLSFPPSPLFVNSPASHHHLVLKVKFAVLLQIIALCIILKKTFPNSTSK